MFVGSDDLPRRSVRADSDDGSAVRVLATSTSSASARPPRNERIAMVWRHIPGIHSSARET